MRHSDEDLFGFGYGCVLFLKPDTLALVKADLQNDELQRLPDHAREAFMILEGIATAERDAKTRQGVG